MDEAVLRSMAKWPDVPAVYGWLTLDRRGNWLLKGERISNRAVVEFIARNYERDGEGRWFFQNGAQRVYVALEYTPLVYRVVSAFGEPLELQTHTARRAAGVAGSWMDENSELLIATEHGIGVVLDRDLESVVPALVDEGGTPLSEEDLERIVECFQTGREALLWVRHGNANVKVEAIRSTDVPRRFGFVATPTAATGEAACS
jgi:Protein of unknown function (DUF2946)